MLSVVSAAIWLTVAPVGADPTLPAAARDAATAIAAFDVAGGVDLGSSLDFRLGTASSPFAGSSTAIADFNTDGQPDLAIADHLARRASGYAYRIEFQISGQPRRNVTFESAQEAVTLSVADVDRDNDLDLVVDAAASGETVGVWLNDGHGHFSSADVRRFQHAKRTASAAITDEHRSITDSSAVTSRAAGAIRADRIHAIVRTAADRLPAIDVQRRPSAWLSSRIQPRAPPPVSFLNSLS